jgi:lysophospholipase L1-like esterase
MKQRHTAWVCVGTNDGASAPTWFYAFRKWEDADEFTSGANDKVSWEIWPCELMTVQETLANFKEIMSESQ